MLPAVDGKPQFIGRVAGELSLEDGRKAATTATLNALSAAKDLLGSLDHVTRVARLGVFIATEGDFRGHPKVADAASELLASVFGADKLASRIGEVSDGAFRHTRRSRGASRWHPRAGAHPDATRQGN
jgi:hypothetical protein